MILQIAIFESGKCRYYLTIYDQFYLNCSGVCSVLSLQECAACSVLSFINISRYTVHYMTLSQSIIWIDNLKNYLLLRLKRNLLRIICFYFFFEFFINHDDISAELIIITKSSLLNSGIWPCTEKLMYVISVSS